MSSSLPMTSWLSVNFDRRNYFAFSHLYCFGCSFLCGNETVFFLVIFRFLQGLGGHSGYFPDDHPPKVISWERSMAQTIYGMGVIIRPDPPVLLVDILWIIMRGLLYFILIFRLVLSLPYYLAICKSPKYAEKTASRDVDWAGIALLALFVGSLQYVLEKGQEMMDWFNNQPMNSYSYGCGGIRMFLFIWRELTFKNPVVQLRVLGNGNLRVGTILSFIMGFGLYGTTFIIPLYTGNIRMDSSTIKDWWCRLL